MGRRGPIPTPTAILKLRGSRLAARRQGEPIPPPGLPKCPGWLTPEEKAIFRQVARLLDGMGIAAATDANPLAMYARMLAKWITYPDPTAREPMRLAGPLLALEREFGLSPASRARIVVPERPAAIVRVRQRHEERPR